MEIVLATRNGDKIKEITHVLEGLDVTIRAIEEFDDVPDVVEDCDTLEGNALKKAREVRDATGVCALADDTGLFVDALDGAPGVHAARYARQDANATYEDNLHKLASEMAGKSERGAEFRCVMALALIDEAAGVVDASASFDEAEGSDDGSTPDALVAEGILPGRIVESARGEGGFGYDPLFEAINSDRTLAEMTLAEKNEISHRYRALVEMRELLLRLGLVASGSQ